MKFYIFTLTLLFCFFAVLAFARVQSKGVDQTYYYGPNKYDEENCKCNWWEPWVCEKNNFRYRPDHEDHWNLI